MRGNQSRLIDFACALDQRPVVRMKRKLHPCLHRTAPDLIERVGKLAHLRGRHPVRRGMRVAHIGEIHLQVLAAARSDVRDTLPSG